MILQLECKSFGSVANRLVALFVRNDINRVKQNNSCLYMFVF